MQDVLDDEDEVVEPFRRPAKLQVPAKAAPEDEADASARPYETPLPEDTARH